MQHKPLHQALEELRTFIRQRLYNYFASAQDEKQMEQFPGWQHESLKHALTPPETVVLLCALAVHFQPDFFDLCIQEFFPKGGEFPAFGGVKGSNTRYTLPTGDTVLFLLAGTDVQKRCGYFRLFGAAHWFGREHLLWLEAVKEGEPRWSGRLIVSNDLIDLLAEGRLNDPLFGPEFPAKHMVTQQSWDDLVLPAATFQHLSDIKAWLSHNEAVLRDPV
ncbi:MAG TPA: ATP-binding protein, partial [Flavisolibacter sp.]|nr:ATP-binding protein [Flavisolibacter sp.]